jgi:hypothetical protein
MQYGCGLFNDKHRIILCMIITFEQAKDFRETAVRGTCNSSKVIFEQLTLEQLHSNNLPRFKKNSGGCTLSKKKRVCRKDAR